MNIIILASQLSCIGLLSAPNPSVLIYTHTVKPNLAFQSTVIFLVNLLTYGFINYFLTQ